MAAPVRGTQTLVDQMGWVFRRPSIVALEVSWRWIFGIPFLLVCWLRVRHILGVLSPEAAGLTIINPQNPWVAVAQLSDAMARYRPYVVNELAWIAPTAAATWIVVSSIGRSVVLKRLEPRIGFRPLTMVILQAVWLALFAAVCWGWLCSIAWVADTHISVGAEPDLIGYSMWAIFFSLGFFTLWALVSWAVSISPLLMLLEKRSAFSSLVQSMRLGKTFTGKLVEIGLVMGIVNLALIVLAMVLSAAPLPFIDQLGADALHVVWAAAAVFYLVATDYFQVVRIKSFIEFLRTFRGSAVSP